MEEWDTSKCQMEIFLKEIGKDRGNDLKERGRMRNYREKGKDIEWEKGKIGKEGNIEEFKWRSGGDTLGDKSENKAEDKMKRWEMSESKEAKERVIIESLIDGNRCLVNL